MKLLIFLFTLIFLASCASTSFQQRKHLSGKFKAPKASLSSIQIKKDKDVVMEREELEQELLVPETTPIHKAIISKDEYNYEDVSSNEHYTFPTQNKESKNLVQDFITRKEYYQEELGSQPVFDDTVFVNGNSVEGELARKTKNQGTASLVLGILSFFPFPLTTLVFSIIGIVLAKSVLRSRYQSEVGGRNARIGKILSIISLSLLIAAILLFITVLFLFGF